MGLTLIDLLVEQCLLHYPDHLEVWATHEFEVGGDAQLCILRVVLEEH